MVKVPTYNELEKKLEKLERKYRKLSEKEKDLRESKEKFRELIYNANSIIFRLDREGNILFINEFAQSFFGYEEFEVLGKNIIGTITPETDTAGLDLKETHKDLLCHPNRYINFENENIKKNGERVWIVWTNKAIYNNDGKLREILSIGNDNTKRKRAEDAQKESENLFNSFMNSLPALAFMKDLDGRYIYFNGACKQFYGVDPSERIGKTDDDLFSPEIARGLKKSDQTVRSEKRVLRVIEKVTVGEDTQYHYTSKFPILKNGEPYFIAGIAIDITERILAEEEKKNLEAQLLHAQKMESLGTLSGGIAHNFNNLLMGIQGNASLAKMDIDRKNPIFIKLNNIEKLVQRGAKLTDQLLGYAQKGQFGIKSINLNKIIKETVNTFGETKKDITVRQDLAEDLFSLEADNDQIDLVILDMIMPDMSGGKTFDKIREIDSQVKVLLSSGYSINGQATQILKRGCNGFIQKPFSFQNLSRKIREILETKN